MQYKIIYLERKTDHVEGDDVYLTFCIQDSEGTILTSLTGWTFQGELYNDANEKRFDNDDFSTSGAIITLLMPNTDTTSLADDYGNTATYTLEIEGTLSEKIYTLLQMEINFKSEEIDY